MPYINQDDRRRFDALLDEFRRALPENGGELNYVISSMLQICWKQGRRNYADINNFVGALECAKQEFYRRVAVPYEERKVAQNGDVYEE